VQHRAEEALQCVIGALEAQESLQQADFVTRASR